MPEAPNHMELDTRAALSPQAFVRHDVSFRRHIAFGAGVIELLKVRKSRGNSSHLLSKRNTYLNGSVDAAGTSSSLNQAEKQGVGSIVSEFEF